MIYSLYIYIKKVILQTRYLLLIFPILSLSCATAPIVPENQNISREVQPPLTVTENIDDSISRNIKDVFHIITAKHLTRIAIMPPNFIIPSTGYNVSKIEIEDELRHDILREAKQQDMYISIVNEALMNKALSDLNKSSARNNRQQAAKFVGNLTEANVILITDIKIQNDKVGIKFALIDTTSGKKYPITEEPGSLLITVNPSPADVYVDGEYKGKANAALSWAKISSGIHEIVVKRVGYKDYKETIEIHPYQSEAIVCVLQKRERETSYASPETPLYSEKTNKESLLFPKIITFDVGYNELYPINNNETFQNVLTGGIPSLYVGLNMYLFWACFGWYNQVGSQGGTNITETIGLSGSVGVGYPFALNLSDNKSIIFYGNIGDHFENIEAKGQDSTTGTNLDSSYSNNSLIVTGGIKFMFTNKNSSGSKNGFGFDLSYAQTFLATYTDYQMLRLGLVYGSL